MEQKTINETNLLINALNDENIESDVKGSKIDNPKESLGFAMLDFFNSRLSEIKKSTDFKQKVRDKLGAKIDNDELKANELARLLVNLEEQDSIKDSSVFTLFRPNQNTAPLLNLNNNNNGKNDTVSGNNDGKSIDIDTQRAVHTLSRMLQTLEKNKNESEK